MKKLVSVAQVQPSLSALFSRQQCHRSELSAPVLKEGQAASKIVAMQPKKAEIGTDIKGFGGLRGGLARCLLSVSVMMSSGLLSVACGDIGSPYPYPVLIPPVITTTDVSPSISTLYVVPNSLDSFDVVIPFRSEDLEQRLYGFLLLDSPPGSEPKASLGDVIVPPGTFDEDRQVTLKGSLASVGVGCHSVTLLLTNENNLDAVGPDKWVPKDPENASWLVWWVLIKDSSSSDPDPSCPGTVGASGAP